MARTIGLIEEIIEEIVDEMIEEIEVQEIKEAKATPKKSRKK